MKLNELSGLGLSPAEVEVYEVLLELGSATAGEIAKNTNLYRSAVYAALQRLERKGLVAFFIGGKKRYFELTDPQMLLELVDSRQRELEQHKREIEKLVSHLLLNKVTKQEKQEVMVFSGIHGVKAFLNLLITEGRKGDTIYAFGIPKEMRTLYGNYFKDYHKKRIAKGIKTKLIFSHAASREHSTGINKLIERRYFSQKYSFPAEVVILNDLVGLLIPSGKPVVFAVRNHEISQSFMNYFELLWKQSKAFKN